MKNVENIKNDFFLFLQEWNGKDIWEEMRAFRSLEKKDFDNYRQ